MRVSISSTLPLYITCKTNHAFFLPTSHLPSFCPGLSPAPFSTDIHDERNSPNIQALITNNGNIHFVFTGIRWKWVDNGRFYEGMKKVFTLTPKKFPLPFVWGLVRYFSESWDYLFFRLRHWAGTGVYSVVGWQIKDRWKRSWSWRTNGLTNGLNFAGKGTEDLILIQWWIHFGKGVLRGHYHNTMGPSHTLYTRRIMGWMRNELFNQQERK